MQENKNYTELIVGSSTSEVFVPQIIKDLYGASAFLAGDGGANTPVRWLFIKEALETNPNLKRIIYVADLFEFKNVELEGQVYYQPELMKHLQYYKNWIQAPNPLDRMYDLISQKSIQNTFKTLKDYKKWKSGNYQSQYREDGTTEKSMVEYKSSEPISSRAARLARSYKTIYGDMTELNSESREFYELMLSELSQRNIELVFIITPWHPIFFDAYKDHLEKTNIYTDWVTYLRGLQKDRVRVLDFSVHEASKKGILDTDEYWHDGVHFSKKSMEIMIKEIYGK